jgi:quercetin dioxygenase-like cupin family protein
MRIVHKGNQTQVREEGGILRKILAQTEKLMMVEYFLPKGSRINDHSHFSEQVSYVVSGRWKIRVGDQEEMMEAGDSAGIPSNERHSVEVLEDTVAIDVFTPQRKELLSE